MSIEPRAMPEIPNGFISELFLIALIYCFFSITLIVIEFILCLIFYNNLMVEILSQSIALFLINFCVAAIIKLNFYS